MTNARDALLRAQSSFALAQSEEVARAVGEVRREIGYPLNTEQAWMLWSALSVALVVGIEGGADQETLDEIEFELRDTACRREPSDVDALPTKALDGWAAGRRAVSAGAPAAAYHYADGLLRDEDVVASAAKLTATPRWDEVDRAHARLVLELCILFVEAVRAYKRPSGRSPFERPDVLVEWVRERGGPLAEHEDAPPWPRFAYYRELSAEARDRGGDGANDLQESAFEALEALGRLPLTGSQYPRAAEAAALL